MRIKGNEEVDKATKEVIDMSGVITTRLVLDHQKSKKLQMAKGVVGNIKLS